EDGFLAAIRLEPADDTARLVFADWLDEQDDPAFKQKSAFIRLELQLATDPDADFVALSIQIQQRATQLPADWLAAVSHPKIEGCPARLERSCPAVWSNLAPTQDPHARTCESCRQTVRFASNSAEVHEYNHRGFCMAVTPAIPRRPDGFTA